MAVLSPNLQINKSGGTANEDPDLSLGGARSTATNRLFVSNFLHNVYDEVTVSEALTGEFEYRHFYLFNNNAFAIQNCKMSVLSLPSAPFSVITFAKGTAANGFVEQAVANENTAPVGISPSDFRIPDPSTPLELGTIAAGSVASVWIRREVKPASLIASNQNLVFRVTADPPPATGPAPDPPDGGQGGGGGGGSPPTPEPVSIAAVGDISCGSNGDETVEVIGVLDPLDVFIANGDLSYSSTADCFIDNVENAGLKEKTRITIGNHDDTEDGSASIRAAFLSEFGVPSGGFYSYQIQNIFFIGMDTQKSYSVGSSQHTFVVAELQKASNSSTVDWIVVYYHKPSITIPSNHAPLTDFRDIYHPLFDTHKVDIIIMSHNHTMQISYPIKYNPSSPSNPTIMSTASDNVYNNIDGRIFIVSGAGGRSHYDLGSFPSHFRFGNDNDFGFLTLNWINNNKSVVGGFISTSAEGEVLEDSGFQINKT